MLYLKTQSLVGPYEYILRDDPAFDQGADAEARKAFDAAYDRALEMGDFAPVPRRPGLEPVVWTLRHLSSGEWRMVQDVTGRLGLNSGLLEAVALALIGVRGIDLAIERIATNARRGCEAVTPATLDRLSEEVVNALGFRVMAAQGPRKG